MFFKGLLYSPKQLLLKLCFFTQLYFKQEDDSFYGDGSQHSWETPALLQHRSFLWAFTFCS